MTTYYYVMILINHGSGTQIWRNIFKMQLDSSQNVTLFRLIQSRTIDSLDTNGWSGIRISQQNQLLQVLRWNWVSLGREAAVCSYSRVKQYADHYTANAEPHRDAFGCKFEAWEGISYYYWSYITRQRPATRVSSSSRFRKVDSGSPAADRHCQAQE